MNTDKTYSTKQKFHEKTIRTMLSVYFLSYLLQSVFVVWIPRVKAESRPTINQVAVFVDNALYQNPQVKNEIQRYATQYIQQRVDNGRALVIPINTSQFKSRDIVKILENLYFDGIKDESSSLVGTILIGDIPLPVVKKNDYVYPSIYPYVDFIDHKFIFDKNSQYFVFKDNNQGQPEIWHGVLNFGANTQHYLDYFQKLKTYHQAPANFIGKRVWFDDFIHLKKVFSAQTLPYYVNKFLFVDDVAYRRYTNLLIDIFNFDNTQNVSSAFKNFNDELNQQKKTLTTADDGSDPMLFDKINDYQDSLNQRASQAKQPEISTSSTPTLFLKKTIDQFFKNYSEIYNPQYLSKVRDAILAGGRYKLADLDYHIKKIEINDDFIKRDNENTPPLIVEYNNMLEKAIDKKIDQEGYYLNIIVPTIYEENVNALSKLAGFPPAFACTIPMTILEGRYESYYFGKRSREIESAQDLSIYRGTYQNFSTLSQLKNYDYTLRNLPGIPIDATLKSVGGTYGFQDRQIIANRGYNSLNVQADMDTYDKLKECEPDNVQSAENFVRYFWGGNSPLNLTGSTELFLKFSEFKYAWHPSFDGRIGGRLYDIGGSKMLPRGKQQPIARSYQAMSDYFSMQRVRLFRIYPRPIKFSIKKPGELLKFLAAFVKLMVFPPLSLPPFSNQIIVAQREDAKYCRLSDRRSKPYNQVEYFSVVQSQTPGFGERVTIRVNGQQQTELKKDRACGKIEIRFPIPKFLKKLFSKAFNKLINGIFTTVINLAMVVMFPPVIPSSVRNPVRDLLNDAIRNGRSSASEARMEAAIKERERIRKNSTSNALAIALRLLPVPLDLDSVSNILYWMKDDFFPVIANMVNALKDRRLVFGGLNTKRRLYEYKTVDSRIKHNAPTPQQINAMNMTTIDRPIDSAHTITFQGLGGELVTMTYPNLYHVEVFKKNGQQITLKTIPEIEQAIRDYLIKTVQAYNQSLADQLAKRINHYNSKKSAFDLAVGADPRSTPNRSYALFPENFLIDLLGQEKIKTIAHNLYYLNIHRKNTLTSNNMIEDIKHKKDTFDLNTKIIHTLDTYLRRGQQQGPLITPDYQEDGYEVAYLNSDGYDFIDTEVLPSFVQVVQNAGANFRVRRNNMFTDVTQSFVEQKIQNECAIGDDGTVPILKWPPAFLCWLKETLKNPLSVKISYKNAEGPVLIGGMFKDFLNIKEGYEKERNLYNSQLFNIVQKNQQVQQALQALPEEERFALQELFDSIRIAWAEMRGQQMLDKADSTFVIEQEPDIPQTKFVSITLKQNFGPLTITYKSTGDNCLIINTTNTCQTPVTIQANPFVDPVLTPVKLATTKAGLSTLEVEYCFQGDICKSEFLTADIVPGKVKKIEIKTPYNVLAFGTTLPVVMRAFDQYNNKLGLVPQAYEIATNLGAIGLGSPQNNRFEFSSFNQAGIAYSSEQLQTQDQSQIATITVRPTQAMQAIDPTLPQATIGIKLVKPMVRFNNGSSQVTELTYTLPDNTEVFFETDANDVKQIKQQNLWKVNILVTDQENNRIPTPIRVEATKGLVKPGIIDTTSVEKKQGQNTVSVQQRYFSPNNEFFTDNGLITVYFYPTFQAGQEIVRVTVPGHPTIDLPITIAPGSPRITQMSLPIETLKLGQSTSVKIFVQDIWGNPVRLNQAIQVGVFGSLTISGQSSSTITVQDGIADVVVTANGEGGKSFIFSQIDGIPLENQLPDIKSLLVQNYMIPQQDLNVMYLTLAGTDRGNLWGYFSDNNHFVDGLIHNSEKLLTVTTNLVDPQRIKKLGVLISDNGQVKNFANQQLSMRFDKNLLIQVGRGATINLGSVSSYQISKIENKQNLTMLTPTQPTLVVVPMGAGVRFGGRSLFVNDQAVIDFDKGIMNSGIGIRFIESTVDQYAEWQISFEGQIIGSLFVIRNDNLFSNTINQRVSITDPSFQATVAFADGSTNGKKGIGISIDTDSLANNDEGYPSFHNSVNIDLSIGFEENFKHLTYFAGGDHVGKATAAFASEFIINIGDPLIKSIDGNQTLQNTNYDGGIGALIFSDPTKSIFRTIDIDFNKDGLKDLLVVYSDGTVRILKNYGGTDPFVNLGSLLIIADGIKDINVGDVDGNGYPDIIIITNNHKARVYKNNQGIFDVDGTPVCLNVPEGPNTLKGVHQIFWEDMDNDGSIDIVTNDIEGSIKIFYGGSTAQGPNYLSTELYGCDQDATSRNQITFVKNFSIATDPTMKIGDDSLIRRQGLQKPPQALNTDGLPTKQLFNTNEDIINQVKNFNLNDFMDKGTRGVLRFVESPIDVFPRYDTNPQAVVYVKMSSLVKGDPVEVYKRYTDLNGGVLRKGDNVRVDVVIVAKQAVVMSMIDRIQGPWSINKSPLGEIRSFDPGTLPGGYQISWGFDQGYEYLIDNIMLSNGQTAQYSYTLTYRDPPPTIKIEIDDIAPNEVSNQYTQNTPDNYKDIKIFPSDGCVKAYFVFLNKNFTGGPVRSYNEIFHNIAPKILAYQNQSQALYQQTMNKLLDTVKQVQQKMDFSLVESMGNFTEKRKPSSLFQSNGQGGFSLNLNLQSEELSNLQAKAENVMRGLCAGFKIGKEPCAGIPVPFNIAFLAPGLINLFGCPIFTDFGLPLFFFPGTLYTPIGPIPIPYGLTLPGVDTFYWAPGGVFPSMIRIYIAPTLTLGLGIAICLGPMNLTTLIPPPFRDMVGNCIVLGMNLPLPCGGNKSSDSSQNIEPWQKDAAKMKCNLPPVDRNRDNTLKFEEQPLESVATPFVAVSIRDGESFAVGGTTVTVGSSQGNAAQRTFPSGTYGGGLINLQQSTFSFTDQPNEENERIVLRTGAPINMRIAMGATMGIIRCIINNWIDRQIQYIINNLTNMTVAVYLPDITDLIKGFENIDVNMITQAFAKSQQDFVQMNKEFNQGVKNFSIKGGNYGLPKQNQLQTLSKGVSNPFDALSVLFQSVPVVGVSTKDINIRVPFLYNEDIQRYVTYLQTYLSVNQRILKDWGNIFADMLGICGDAITVGSSGVTGLTTNKQSSSFSKKLKTEWTALGGSRSILKKYQAEMRKELDLKDEARKEKFLGVNNQTQEQREETNKQREEKLKNIQNNKQELQKELKAIEEESALMKQRKTIQRCVQFFGDLQGVQGSFNYFLSFEENTGQLFKTIRENLRVLDQYRKFPLELYGWIHIIDRYLSEVSAIINDVVGQILNWLQTNARRFEKYVDVIITLIGIIKSWQIIIDFSVNRQNTCAKCKVDTYDLYGCLLAFLCPPLPILPIPPFKIPSIFFDLTHIDLGIDIVLPRFNFVPTAVPLPRLPNLPSPPSYRVTINPDDQINILFELINFVFPDLGLRGGISIPDIPILPSPPRLPELPSFIPSIELTLPVLPPAPKIPRIAPSIEILLNITKFLSFVFCILKGSIGIVSEQGTKSKIEQLTQRTRQVPFFDTFLTRKVNTPLRGFDYKIDAYVNFRYNFDYIYQFFGALAEMLNKETNTFMTNVVEKSVNDLTQNTNRRADEQKKALDGEINLRVQQLTNTINNLLKNLNNQPQTGKNLTGSTEELIDDGGLRNLRNILTGETIIQDTPVFEQPMFEPYDTGSNILQMLDDFQSYRGDDGVDHEIVRETLRKGLYALAAEPGYTNKNIDTLQHLFDTPLEIQPNIQGVTDLQSDLSRMITTKQQEVNSIKQSLINDYDRFLDTISRTQLVNQTDQRTSLSLQLFKGNEKIVSTIMHEQHPMKTYSQLNRIMAQGFKKALQNNPPEKLNMDPGMRQRVLTEAQRVNRYIDKIEGFFDESKLQKPELAKRLAQNNTSLISSDFSSLQGITPSDTTVHQLSASKQLLAQSPAPASSTPSPGDGGTLFEFSEYVQGIFVRGSQQLDRTLYKVVESEKISDRIGSNFYQVDLTKNNKKDLVMRDDNSVYVKYAQGQKTYSQPLRSTRLYEFPVLSSPQNLQQRVSDTNGYLTVQGLAFKVWDTHYEVKDFRLQGQNFDNLSFTWMNSDYSNDDVAGYVIKLTNRVDILYDKFGADAILDMMIPRLDQNKFILVLPYSARSYTGDLIDLQQELRRNTIDSYMTGIIVDIKYYNPTDDQISIGLTDMERKRYYIKIASLIKAPTTTPQQNLYTKASPRSHQEVAGMQVLADTQPPAGTFTLHRITKDTQVAEGNNMNAYVGTYYDLRAKWTDNVRVANNRVEYSGSIINTWIKSGATIRTTNDTLSISGIFYTGTETLDLVFGAIDEAGNMHKEKVKVVFGVPKIELVNIEFLSNDFSNIIAMVDQDLDEATVTFEREKNGNWITLTGIMFNTPISQFSLTTNQFIVTGGLFPISESIGLFMPSGERMAVLNKKTGQIRIEPAFKDRLRTAVSFKKRVPMIEIVDIQQPGSQTLFEIFLAPQALISLDPVVIHNNSYEMLDIDTSQMGPFQGGYCIKPRDGECEFLIGPQGQMYVGQPHNLDYIGTYHYDSLGYIVYTVYKWDGTQIFSLRFIPQPLK